MWRRLIDSWEGVECSSGHVSELLLDYIAPCRDAFFCEYS
jgi:hypothetical protein